jgi:hypothetical protein
MGPVSLSIPLSDLGIKVESQISDQEKKLYESFAMRIEEIPVNQKLRISSIRYGESFRAEKVTENQLLFLPSDIKLPKEFVGSEGSEAYVLKSLSEIKVQDLLENQHLYFPHKIAVDGQRSQKGSIVVVYICTDRFYFQGVNKSFLKRENFEVDCLLGRGGIAAFVKIDGSFQNNNKFVLGNGLGGVGAICAVEFLNSKPINRSRYVVVIRKGIRYPDDIWISKKTGKPITNRIGDDISEGRFIFQSTQINGSSSDIFVADFNGENMYHLNRKNNTEYDGFYDSDEQEVAQWTDERNIQYSSMRKGKRITKTSLDPRLEDTHSQV